MVMDFTYEGKKYSPIQLQKGILAKESSFGTNTAPRYEPKFHKKLKANVEWVPTPAERKVIAERGYEDATKEFSTSRGAYQILPETAYRYTSFAGKPEDLEDNEVATKIWLELMGRMHRKSGGDLKKAVNYWNQGSDYLETLVPWME